MVIETAQDQEFVTQFLKEINDIDDINSRFQQNIQQKTNETFLKYVPQSEMFRNQTIPDQNFYNDFEYKALQQHLQDEELARVDENARSDFNRLEKLDDSEVKGDSTFLTTEPLPTKLLMKSSVKLKYNDKNVKINLQKPHMVSQD